MKYNQWTLPAIAVGVVAAGIGVYAVQRVRYVAPPVPRYEAQQNVSDEITVIVTPVDIAATANLWKFEVTMSTHVQELGGYDLAAMATLVDDSGKTYRPIAWQPDAKEGHHIGGLLQFKKVESTKNIELRIKGVGKSSERVFRWNVQ